MRLVRVSLIAIALMASCRLALADSPAICAEIAGNSGNPMATNVDAWLTQFRAAYAACLSKHKISGDMEVPHMYWLKT